MGIRVQVSTRAQVDMSKVNMMLGEKVANVVMLFIHDLIRDDMKSGTVGNMENTLIPQLNPWKCGQIRFD